MEKEIKIKRIKYNEQVDIIMSRVDPIMQENAVFTIGSNI